jgi:hypothetical protein|nr:MAG TPA: hypothetical protein [Caudoviricetes sp.]
MEVYKPEIKKFLGHKVRVITVELKQYIILNDMFDILGKLDKNKSIPTNYKNKFKKFLAVKGLPDIFKLNTYTNHLKPKSRKHQHYYVYDFKLIQEYWDEISLLFNKNGYNCVAIRDELNFVSKVKDFFKYDNYIFIKDQFPMMEYHIDMVIGNSVFIEFDEPHHNSQSSKDIERMKQVALANTAHIYHGDGQIWLYDTNNYKTKQYKHMKYEGFETYEFDSAFFIRIHALDIMNWIPLVYAYYVEYMDAMLEQPCTLIKYSSDLTKYQYSS